MCREPVQVNAYISGPREKKQQLLLTVVTSKLTYVVAVWTKILRHHSISDYLFVQGGLARRVVSANKTVSASAVLVLTILSISETLLTIQKEME